MGFLVISLVCVWIIFGIVGRIVGEKRDAKFEGFILGLFLGPLGLLMAFFVDNRPQCQRCRSRVDRKASLCPSCRRPIDTFNAMPSSGKAIPIQTCECTAESPPSISPAEARQSTTKVQCVADWIEYVVAAAVAILIVFVLAIAVVAKLSSTAGDTEAQSPHDQRSPFTAQPGRTATATASNSKNPTMGDLHKILVPCGYLVGKHGNNMAWKQGVDALYFEVFGLGDGQITREIKLLTLYKASEMVWSSRSIKTTDKDEIYILNKNQDWQKVFDPKRRFHLGETAALAESTTDEPWRKAESLGWKIESCTTGPVNTSLLGLQIGTATEYNSIGVRARNPSKLGDTDLFVLIVWVGQRREACKVYVSASGKALQTPMNVPVDELKPDGQIRPAAEELVECFKGWQGDAAVSSPSYDVVSPSERPMRIDGSNEQSSEILREVNSLETKATRKLQDYLDGKSVDLSDLKTQLDDLEQRARALQTETINRKPWESGYPLEVRKGATYRMLIEQGQSPSEARDAVEAMVKSNLLPDPPRQKR